MTNAEAIKDIEENILPIVGGKSLLMAIEALKKAPTALDHIHNVVSEREYQRGYEKAKEEYDHKLTEIRSRIKDHYYNLGYEQGKADANRPEIPDSCNAETVEAIPLDWIESYALLAEADGRPFFAEGIRDMVEEWKQAQKGS